METKKLIVYGLIVFLIFLAGYLIYTVFFIKKELTEIAPQISPPPEYKISPAITSVTIPQTEKIKAGGVEVSNFYGSSKQVITNGDVIIAESGDFQLVYAQNSDYFNLLIINSPFEEVRAKSEKELLKLLDISQEEACKLNLQVSTPFFANPENAGGFYPLSFCE